MYYYEFYEQITVNALDHWLDDDKLLEFYLKIFCSEYSINLNKVLRDDIAKKST